MNLITRRAVAFITPTSPKLFVWGGFLIVGFLAVAYASGTLPEGSMRTLGNFFYVIHLTDSVIPFSSQAAFLSSSGTYAGVSLTSMILVYILNTYIWSCCIIELFNSCLQPFSRPRHTKQRARR